MSEPIAITGTSAICSAGDGLEPIFEALRRGRSAFAPLREWDSSSWPAPLAGGVEDLDATAIFEDRKLLKALQRLRRTDLLGLHGASRTSRRSQSLRVDGRQPVAPLIAGELG